MPPFFVSSTHHIIRNHWTETLLYDGLSYDTFSFCASFRLCIIHCIPEVHVHFHNSEHLFGLQAKAIIINIFCQLLTIY